MIKITAENTMESASKHLPLDGKSKQLKITVTDKRSLEEREWGQKCGCPNGTKILVQKRLPINCACIFHDYEKRLAPGGRGSATTVTNSIKRIVVLDVDEADKKLSTYIKFHYCWEDGRISSTFRNNESKILVTREFSEHMSLSIWAPTRSLKNGRKTKSKWKLLFLNHFPNYNAMIRGYYSGKLISVCKRNNDYS